MKAPVISPAWAQVRIHLNLGDMAGATQAALEAVKTTPMRASVEAGGALIIGHPALPVGWCFMEPSRGWAILSFDVWSQHGWDPVVHRFTDQALSLPLASFVPYDLTSWQLQTDLDTVENGLDPSFWFPDRKIF